VTLKVLLTAGCAHGTDTILVNEGEWRGRNRWCDTCLDWIAYRPAPPTDAQIAAANRQGWELLAVRR
jgi:hypothetical protein